MGIGMVHILWKMLCVIRHSVVVSTLVIDYLGLNPNYALSSSDLG